MAAKTRRWNQALFPIDEGLIEKLLDGNSEAGSDADEPSAPDPQCESADDDSLLWEVAETESEAETMDELADDAAAQEAAVWDDAYAINMRVLNDYLRRRFIEEPEPPAPTLH